MLNLGVFAPFAHNDIITIQVMLPGMAYTTVLDWQSQVIARDMHNNSVNLTNAVVFNVPNNSTSQQFRVLYVSQYFFTISLSAICCTSYFCRLETQNKELCNFKLWMDSQCI